MLSGVKKVLPHLDVDNVEPGGYMVMARAKGPPCGPWRVDRALLNWHGVDTVTRDANKSWRQKNQSWRGGSFRMP